MSIRLVITALSVVILVLSLVVYHLYSKTSKTQNEPLSEDKLVLNMGETKAPEAKQEAKPETVAPAPVPAPAPVAEQKPVALPKTTLVAKAPAAPAAVITQKIVITATADLWVKVKIDDGKPFDFLLRTGGVKKLEGTKEIKILLGDASAGTIEYNGEVMKNLGEKGFMRSIVFPGLGKWQDALVR